MSLDVYLVFGNHAVAYSRNITHNLNTMADAAGIYKAVWHPNENGFNHAKDIIGPLREGLKLLQSDPKKFAQFNPENGWGNYDNLCEFVVDYLAACEEEPDARIEVSR